MRKRNQSRLIELNVLLDTVANGNLGEASEALDKAREIAERLENEYVEVTNIVHSI